MTSIQLATLPGARVQPKDRRRKTVPMGQVMLALVDALPGLAAKNNIALGIDSLHESESYLVDVEYRESGYSSNPADLRVVAMITDDRPDDADELREVRNNWYDVMNNWFWDNKWQPPEIIDIKLIFGC